MLRSKHKPAAYSLVLVAGDLLGRPKAAPAHHHQECSAYLFGRCAQSVHRGVVSLTEPGAAASTVVTLTASQGAVSYHVRSRALGIGAGWFGSRGAHIGPPYSPSAIPHVNRVTTAEFDHRTKRRVPKPADKAVTLGHHS